MRDRYGQRVLSEVQVAETWVGREHSVDDEKHSSPGKKKNSGHIPSP